MTFRKILLAEDDADDQKLFCDFLSHRQDIVIMPVVENGEELLTVLENTTSQDLPHVIVLDQNMPKRNGLQTLAALKAEARFSHLPVVIYSTYADEELVSNSMAAGAALVIAKPISKKGYEEMIDAILNLLD
ncbi:response regulator [Flavisolibacter nicotianae]|uniref:response regulator n=1 Tax=Flavisolibacter nicotianae TaxID=2364882 RepID=UPI000EAD47B7|nr:response regulator [Flavisolibacter nicotianae]